MSAAEGTEKAEEGGEKKKEERKTPFFSTRKAPLSVCCLNP